MKYSLLKDLSSFDDVNKIISEASDNNTICEFDCILIFRWMSNSCYVGFTYDKQDRIAQVGHACNLMQPLWETLTENPKYSDQFTYQLQQAFYTVQHGITSVIIEEDFDIADIREALEVLCEDYPEEIFRVRG